MPLLDLSLGSVRAPAAVAMCPIASRRRCRVGGCRPRHERLHPRGGSFQAAAANGGRRRRQQRGADDSGGSRLTAAIPMGNPYCSCKLTRVRPGPRWFAAAAAASPTSAASPRAPSIPLDDWGPLPLMLVCNCYIDYDVGSITPCAIHPP